MQKPRARTLRAFKTRFVPLPDLGAYALGVSDLISLAPGTGRCSNDACYLLSGGAFCGYFPVLGGDFVKDSAQKVRDRLPGG